MARKHQIWNDACDEGVSVTNGDAYWSYMMLLVDMYGDKKTRKANGSEVQIDFTLIDEWAVSDEIKTVKEATQKFRLTYCSFGKRKNQPSLIYKGHDGFFNIELI